MDGWMNGWMNEWMDRWMDGWINEYLNEYLIPENPDKANESKRFHSPLLTAIPACNQHLGMTMLIASYR